MDREKLRDEMAFTISEQATRVMQVHDFIAMYAKIHEIHSLTTAAACKLVYDEVIEGVAKEGDKGDSLVADMGENVEQRRRAIENSLSALVESVRLFGECWDGENLNPPTEEDINKLKEKVFSKVTPEDMQRARDFVRKQEEKEKDG